MKTYKLYTYDLCGNKKDGYEVNDLHSQCIIKLSDNPTDIEIKRALYNCGVFSRGITNASLQIEGESDYALYIHHIAVSVGGFKPLCELRLVKDAEPTTPKLICNEGLA